MASMPLTPMVWTSQPQYPVRISPTAPTQRWAAVQIMGQAPFGSASPVATLVGTAKIDSGRAGRNLNIVAAGDYLSFGTNAGLQLSIQSGVMLVELASINSTATFYCSSLTSNGGFALVTSSSTGKLEMSRHNAATIMFSSNALVVGLNAIAWSYNNVTGRARLAINGVVASGASSQSLTHDQTALGRYNIQDGTVNSFPHQQYLFAISPDEIFSDRWLAHITRSPNAPWELFAPSKPRIYTSSAAGGTPATVNPAGVSATGSVGTPVATGAAVATPVGLLATTSVGTPTATGGSSIAATALPVGISAVTAVGQPTAIGQANAMPNGVAVASAVGLGTATGAANATPAGVFATASVGTPVAIAGTSIPATALPAGVSVASAVGVPTATGAATALPAGIAALAAVGTPIAVIPATALPGGVAATAYTGTPVVKGAGVALPLGVQAQSFVGMPTVLVGVAGAAIAYPAGIQAIGSVGNLIATGAAWCYPAGLVVLASIGTPVVVGPVTESIYRMYVPLAVNHAYVPIAVHDAYVPLSTK